MNEPANAPMKRAGKVAEPVPQLSIQIFERGEVIAAVVKTAFPVTGGGWETSTAPYLLSTAMPYDRTEVGHDVVKDVLRRVEFFLSEVCGRQLRLFEMTEDGRTTSPVPQAED